MSSIFILLNGPPIPCTSVALTLYVPPTPHPYSLLTHIQFISTITHLLLALSLHPEVLQKARAEINSVVGEDRLPDFSDRPRLSYVEAVLNELWRWSCPVPLGAFPPFLFSLRLYMLMSTLQVFLIVSPKTMYTETSAFQKEA